MLATCCTCPCPCPLLSSTDGGEALLVVRSSAGGPLEEEEEGGEGREEEEDEELSVRCALELLVEVRGTESVVAVVSPTEVAMTGTGAGADRGMGEGRGEGDRGDAREEEDIDEEEDEDDEVGGMVVAADTALAAPSILSGTTVPSLSLTRPLFLSRFRFPLFCDDLSSTFISTLTADSSLPSTLL